MLPLYFTMSGFICCDSCFSHRNNTYYSMCIFDCVSASVIANYERYPEEHSSKRRYACAHEHIDVIIAIKHPFSSETPQKE